MPLSPFTSASHDPQLSIHIASFPGQIPVYSCCHGIDTMTNHLLINGDILIYHIFLICPRGCPLAPHTECCKHAASMITISSGCLSAKCIGVTAPKSKGMPWHRQCLNTRQGCTPKDMFRTSIYGQLQAFSCSHATLQTSQKKNLSLQTSHPWLAFMTE